MLLKNIINSLIQFIVLNYVLYMTAIRGQKQTMALQ